MSIDLLQEKIRRCHNPAMLHLELTQDLVPQAVLEQAGSLPAAYGAMSRAVLEALRGIVPAVRISYASFALLGSAGILELESVMQTAQTMGYYVLLDWMRSDGPALAKATADTVLGNWSCDGITLPPYLGSESVTPFLPYCKNPGKTVFLQVKSANRSGSEIQDLMTGGRLVHTAVADLCSSLGQDCLGRYGYSQVAAMASASAASSLQQLRSRYPRMFLLVDGFNFTNGNGKSCSAAFDRLGRGAVVCAGSVILGAWQENPELDYVEAAVNAAQRMKKILGNYVTTM